MTRVRRSCPRRLGPACGAPETATSPQPVTASRTSALVFGVRRRCRRLCSEGGSEGGGPSTSATGSAVDLPGQVVLGSGVDRAAMHTNDAQMRLGVGCWSSGAGLVSVDAAASSAVTMRSRSASGGG